MLSIISPTRDRSNEKTICEKFVRRETDKRKIVIVSDETSLSIKEEKHIGEIKYKTLLPKKV